MKTTKMLFTTTTILTAVVLAGDAPALQEKPTKVHRSSDFGWAANQDVTEAFSALLDSGKLKAGEELVLDHKYRISGSHTLPDNFGVSSVAAKQP